MARLLGRPAVAVLALVGCARPMARGPAPEVLLRLGVPTSGEVRVRHDDPFAPCSFDDGWAGLRDVLYRFDVAEAGSYRFELEPDFRGLLAVTRPRQGADELLLACASFKRGGHAEAPLALPPGSYRVYVDGAGGGRYRLGVARDASPSARLRPEEPGQVASLCAGGAAFSVGGRALGVFTSVPGGARASCGVTGGNAVHRLALPRAARVRLRAAAHFPLAVEVRAGCGGPVLGCARAAEGRFEVELVVELGAGEHYVVVDATGFEPPDRGLPQALGVGVTGAYVVDAEELP
jgi:hypothetical protein